MAPGEALGKIEEMCTDYETITIYSGGCINPTCNTENTVRGPDCPKKPSNGPRTTCKDYVKKYGPSKKVKGKCPNHRDCATVIIDYPQDLHHCNEDLVTLAKSRVKKECLEPGEHDG
ncbi:hypothetical protein N7454_003243 [Penicillium verhagenii]|nr:hypothetical protein N7454_003243 [Penicillium verhagenii]